MQARTAGARTDRAVESEAPWLLTAREACKLLNIGSRKLWGMTNDPSSGLPSMRIGRKVLYPRDGLVAWIARQVEGGAQ